MYVAKIPNRNSNPTYLIRESYRDNGKVKNRTIANITQLSINQIEAMKLIFKGIPLVQPDQAFEIMRSLPHGHVAAVLGLIKSIGLDYIIASKSSIEKNLILAMIVSRIICPSSKLATAQGLNDETAFTSLGEILGIKKTNEADLYHAMDWLIKRQDIIETKLAKKHFAEGSLFLYDLTSTYFEGKKCPLAAFGHNRDKKKGKRQIVIGLLCNKQGCPISVQVFKGNTSDSTTILSEIKRIREKYGIKKIVIVGDRGMITKACIEGELKKDEDISWITALRSQSIKKLVEENQFEPELFDDWGLATITSEDYPGERLIVCKNSFLALERRIKRQDLIEATNKLLDKIKEATVREKRKLKGKDKIGKRAWRVIDKYKVAKFYSLAITESTFEYTLDEEKIKAEEALDGIYIIRSSVCEDELSSEKVVEAYKDLSKVESAFRSIKTVSLKVRPVYHYLEDRVRSHVFICMLAYYVEWHMRERLASILFIDENKKYANVMRESIVAPALRSGEAMEKDKTKKTQGDFSVHSFATLFRDLATLTKNKVRVSGVRGESFYMYSTPTAFQAKVFELLGVSYKT